MPVGRPKAEKSKEGKKAPDLEKWTTDFLYFSSASVDDIEFEVEQQKMKKVDDTKVGKFIVQLKLCVVLFCVVTVEFCFKMFATSFFM